MRAPEVVEPGAVEPATVEPVLARAVRAGEAAALAAGVTIRELSDLGDLEAVVRLYAGIWGRDANPPVTLELLRAFTKVGSYVAGASNGDQLVGACVGFFTTPAENALHSHIAGVSQAAAGRNIGFALKVHQRRWSLQRGLTEISWTFDPLVRRNAHFNLVKLGARADEYLPNFYGAMRDAINGGDDTDRVLVRWPLEDPDVAAACEGRNQPAIAAGLRAAGAVVALGRSEDDAPVPGQLDGRVSLVAVPTDIEAMRRVDAGLARQWRLALRHTVTSLAATGARVTGFDRSGWYVVEHDLAERRAS